MTRKEKWDSISQEERIEIIALRKHNKSAARAFRDSNETLNDEQLSFMKDHLPKSRSQRKREGLGAWAKINKAKEAQLEKYKTKGDIRLEELRTKINGATKLMSIDVEQHEGSGAITEVGISIYDVASKQCETKHYVITETYNLRNGRRVPDNKDNFDFGYSTRISIDDLKDILSECTSSCFIVGHAFQNDIDYLKQYVSFKPHQILDTQYFAKYYYGTNQMIGLKTMLDDLKIPYQNLHNGGNDAYFTMQCLLELSKGKKHVDDYCTA